jgi:hypothetical protein
MGDNGSIITQLVQKSAEDKLTAPIKALYDAAKESRALDPIHNGDNRAVESFTRHARMIENTATRYLQMAEGKPGFTRRVEGETLDSLRTTLSGLASAYMQDYGRYVTSQAGKDLIANANLLRNAVESYNHAQAEYVKTTAPKNHPRIAALATGNGQAV